MIKIGFILIATYYVLSSIEQRILKLVGIIAALMLTLIMFEVILVKVSANLGRVSFNLFH
jgi:hypothetical protein